MSFASRVFAVTGGASGMGLATAKLLSKRGAAAVCIGDLNTKNFESATKAIKDANPDTIVDTFELDVSKPSIVKSWIEGIVAKHGRLDGAANVAGVPQMARQNADAPTILDETDSTWKLHMSVNLDGVFYCTREEVRAMHTLRARGSIVNVSSMAAINSGPNCMSYGVAKAAATSFGARVAKDVAPFGIRVNTVLPGATNTPMLSKFFSGDPVAAAAGQGYELVQPEDIAAAIVYLLGDDANQINGVSLPVGPGH